MQMETPAATLCSCSPFAPAAAGAAAYALLVNTGLAVALARALLPRQVVLLATLLAGLLRMVARLATGRVRAALAAWREPPVVVAANPADAPAPNVVMRRPRLLRAADLPASPLTSGSALPPIPPAPAPPAAPPIWPEGDSIWDQAHLLQPCKAE